MVAIDADVDTDRPAPGHPRAVGTSEPHAEGYMRAIHRNHRAALLRFLRSVIPPSAGHTAEDLLQETMLRVWRNLHAVPVEAESQRRWLFTVARRLAIDAFRRRQARPAEVSLVDAESFAAGYDATEVVIAKLMLRQAVARLSATHRTVLSELYVRGHSPDETAARLGVPVGTVRSRAHYAMRSLRDALSSD